MSLSVYVASHYAEKELSRGLRSQLLAAGFGCTSRWLDEEPATDPSETEKRTHAAIIDINDVQKADVLLLRNPPESHRKGTGGRRVEFGAALASGMPILILAGPSENVFDNHPSVTICPDMDCVIAKLKELEASWIAPKQAAVLADHYQAYIDVFARYPGKGTGSPEALIYTLIGQIGELGETVRLVRELVQKASSDFTNGELKEDVTDLLSDMDDLGERAEELKRPIRDGRVKGLPTSWKRPLTDDERSKLRDELGDCRWYQDRSQSELGLKASEVLWGNITKLTRRLKNGTLLGSGSSR